MNVFGVIERQFKLLGEDCEAIIWQMDCLHVTVQRLSEALRCRSTDRHELSAADIAKIEIGINWYDGFDSKLSDVKIRLIPLAARATDIRFDETMIPDGIIAAMRAAVDEMQAISDQFYDAGQSLESRGAQLSQALRYCVSLYFDLKFESDDVFHAIKSIQQAIDARTKALDKSSAILEVLGFWQLKTMENK